MVRIHFRDLQVNQISNSSGIFSGSNQQRGFTHTVKQNQTFGTVTGQRCRVTDSRILMRDRDVRDTTLPKDSKDL